MDVLIKTYFEHVYPHVRSELYYPSRKNSGIFVTLCFCAAGSSHFPFTKRKRYTSEDVPLQRKLYDGSRKMTPEIKASFNPFDVDGLARFYEENIEDGEAKKVMLAFGIPPTTEIRKACLCRALAIQLRTFVDSDTDEADDIVLMEYQRLLSEPQEEQIEAYSSPSVLYPGDKIYLKSQYQPTYQVNIYEKFQHTWMFENVGTQVWRGRKLYFFNYNTVHPRAEQIYIDIPETPPHKGVKITASMDARGFEGKSKCRWIMVDSENNDCFPNSDTFTFVVSTKFDYK